MSPEFLPEIDFAALAARFGTPLYVYDEATILRQLAQLRRYISAEIRFAVKANSNIQILKLLRENGCGFDVVSGGELERALLAGADPAAIVFSGVGKTDAEILLAIEKNIQAINVESLQELDVINELAAARNLIARVALRVNPALDAQTHPHLTTGIKHSKFGIAIDQVKPAVAHIKRNLHSLNLVGLASHIGSQVLDAQILITAYQTLSACARELDHKLELLDFGGGFGVPYTEFEPELDLNALGAALADNAGAHLCLIEPGRYILAPAGALLAQVLYLKHSSDGHTTVVIDAGMNDLLRPALYGASHPIRAVTSKGATTRVDLVGPVCESACVLARDYPLPQLRRGDIIAIFLSGAYCAAMSSNYNSRTLAAEVLIRSNQTPQLIRRRQHTSEIWQNEVFD